MTKRELFVFEYQKTLKPQEERNKLLYDNNGEKSPKIQKLEIKNVSDDDYYNTEISIYDIKMIKVIVEMN